MSIVAWIAFRDDQGGNPDQRHYHGSRHWN
jgi:hypothetical protein